MNDFSEIEGELKKLRPAPVRPELLAEIENALARPAPERPTSGVLPPRRSARGTWLPLGLGLSFAGAALFLILTRIADEQPRSPQKPVTRAKPIEQDARNDLRFVPVGFTEVVYRTRDEGLQFPEGGEQPVRRLRYETRETLRWSNPGTGATLQVSYPNEEVVLIPVSGQ